VFGVVQSVGALVAVTVLAFAVAAWLAASVSLTLNVLDDYASTRKQDSACPAPEDPSVFGNSTFQWWPPGKVCHYEDGTVERPTAELGYVLIALAVTGVAGGVSVFLVTRRARASAHA
jgi:hypothetical protein